MVSKHGEVDKFLEQEESITEQLTDPNQVMVMVMKMFMVEMMMTMWCLLQVKITWSRLEEKYKMHKNKGKQLNAVPNTHNGQQHSNKSAS